MLQVPKYTFLVRDEEMVMNKSAMVAALLTIVLLALPPEAWSQTFICSSNPDYFSKRCTIHPNAIDRKSTRLNSSHT